MFREFGDKRTKGLTNGRTNERTRWEHYASACESGLAD